MRELFEKANNSRPSIIYFDEADSLLCRRSDGSSGSSNYSERLVNQFLTEMDGIDVSKINMIQQRNQVYLLASTNRLELIDPAFLRPGRFDLCLNINLPNQIEVFEYLQEISKHYPFNKSITIQDWEELSRKMDG